MVVVNVLPFMVQLGMDEAMHNTSNSNEPMPCHPKLWEWQTNIQVPSWATTPVASHYIQAWIKVVLEDFQACHAATTYSRHVKP